MDSDFYDLLEGKHHDPFTVLGKHPDTDGKCVHRSYQPHAKRVAVFDQQGDPIEFSPSAVHPGLFIASYPQDRTPSHPELEIETEDDHRYRVVDPYCFEPLIGETDIYLLGEGNHYKLWQMLGANVTTIDGIDGVRFAVWAPNAARVSVVGDFNNWDGRRHPMRVRGQSGVWELFIPGMHDGDLYKFELRNRYSGQITVHTDPLGKYFELRPNTAARVIANDTYSWQDGAWLEQRRKHDWLHQPMSVYEAHLGSWKKDGDEFMGYRELADQLIPYVVDRGFTHIELLPITEHPFDGSWGYQTTGYYAPTSRHGSPDDFRYFVDRAHQAGLGIILDWVPAHFPRDSFALARFDGSALYEHEDPRRGEHRDWGTLIFNYGRNEVSNFLVASALYWAEEFHIDGLRVDAVASMLYLDYSRNADDWLPNIHGGRENLEAIEFLRHMNHVVQSEHPGVLVMAEESTAWPMVTRPPEAGGLGFAIKWNMGWMNDTLSYFQEDPINRQYHHNNLTFGLLYGFSENFILPFSHDEVVHGKASLLHKMPGDEWQRFANLRLLMAYQFTYPGKKLLFMGCEFGQGNEWNHASTLDWWMLDYPLHQGVLALVDTLNRLYRDHPALHQRDFDASGFEWVDCNDRQHSVVSFQRNADDEQVMVVMNFTPMIRRGYRIGVGQSGHCEVLFNSDDNAFGGSGAPLEIQPVEAEPLHGKPFSFAMNLPPLGAVVLKVHN